MAGFQLAASVSGLWFLSCCLTVTLSRFIGNRKEPSLMLLVLWHVSACLLWRILCCLNPISECWIIKRYFNVVSGPNGAPQVDKICNVAMKLFSHSLKTHFIIMRCYLILLVFTITEFTVGRFALIPAVFICLFLPHILASWHVPGYIKLKHCSLLSFASNTHTSYLQCDPPSHSSFSQFTQCFTLFSYCTFLCSWCIRWNKRSYLIDTHGRRFSHNMLIYCLIEKLKPFIIFFLIWALCHCFTHFYSTYILILVHMQYSMFHFIYKDNSHESMFL